MEFISLSSPTQTVKKGNLTYYKQPENTDTPYHASPSRSQANFAANCGAIRAHAAHCRVFLPLLPKGGEGRGEEPVVSKIKSPHPGPLPAQAERGCRAVSGARVIATSESICVREIHPSDGESLRGFQTIPCAPRKPFSPAEVSLARRPPAPPAPGADGRARASGRQR